MSCIYRYKIIKEHRCAVCGCRFSIPYGWHRTWQYRTWGGRKRLYLCGYRCYQESMQKRSGGGWI